MRDALTVSIQERLEENEKEIVPLMSQLCLFRSKMAANYVNYVNRPYPLFTKEEEATVSEYIKLWEGYSGVKVDKNKFKTRQKLISYSIRWLDVSFGFVLANEYEQWGRLNGMYDGWFAMMIDFGMKCYERMTGLETDFDIETYSFWEQLKCIAVCVGTIVIDE